MAEDAGAGDKTDSLSLMNNVTINRKVANPCAWNATITNPFKNVPRAGNTVRTVKVEQQKEQIEATVEMIDVIKHFNCPRGLILNNSVVSSEKKATDKLDNVKKVLGCGNSAKDIVLVEDTGTGKDYAVKKIMLSQFNKDEILAWVHLAETGKAPQLYKFELKDNDVIMSMEPMEGITLQDLIDNGRLADLKTARSFSLLLLRDLLQTFEILKEGSFTHGDMHAGNVMVQPCLLMKLFDFGCALSMLRAGINHPQRLKSDVVGIIRMFCMAYTCGVDFEDLTSAQKALQTEDYKELSQYLGHLEEHQRLELFDLMTVLFDTVRSEAQEQFADTEKVAKRVEGMLPIGKELDDMKRKLAVIIFPERFKPDQHDGPEFSLEAECSGFGNPIFDDPELADLASIVDLKVFGNPQLLL